MSVVQHSGRIVAVGDYPGDHVWVRIATPLAGQFRPGHWLQLDGRPWAVLRATAHWVEGLQRALPAPALDAQITLCGPLGPAFTLDNATRRALLVGGGSGGIAALVFLADVLRRRRPRVKPLLLLTSPQPLPFRPQPSRIMVPGLPAWVIAAMPLMEDWAIPSRLATPLGLPGCFDGAVEELARAWLEVAQGVTDVTLYACGPQALLAEAGRLAQAYRLACQALPAVD